MKIKVTALLAAVLLSFTANAQFNYVWNQVVLGGSGAIPNFYSHPKAKDVYFATTDVGTSYSWNVEKQGWDVIMMFDNIPSTYWTWEYGIRCGEIAVDPNDATGNILYATIASGLNATGGVRHNIGTVMKSTDRGQTWTDLNLAFYHDPNGGTKRLNNRLTVDPLNSNNVWLATDRNGTMKSMDAGATWSKVNTGYPDTVYSPGTTNFVAPIRFLVSDPSGGTITNSAGQPASKVMYMGTLQGVFKSENAGESFTLIPGSPRGLSRATMHKDGTLFVTYSYSENNATVQGAQKYSNKSWVDIAPVPNGNFSQVAVNPNNSNEVVIGTTGTWNKDAVYRSTNGGVIGSWVKINATKDNLEAPHLSLGGITLGNVANSAFGYYWDEFYPNKIWSADMSGVVATENIWAATTHWSMRVKGLEEVMATGKLVAPNSGENELLTATADVGGGNYKDVLQFPEPLNGLEVSIWHGFNGQSVAYQENNPDFVVRIATDSWDIINRSMDRSGYSLDGGKTYTRFNPDAVPGLRGRVHITNNGRIIWMTQSSFSTPANSSTLGGIFYSDDKGVTWTESKGIPRGTLAYGGIWNISSGEDKMAVDKVDPNLVYVTDRRDPSMNNNNAFYVSADGGANFVKQATANNLPGIWTWPNGSCYTTTSNLQTVPGSRGEIWYGSDSQYSNSGIYYSTDAGKTFTHLNWTKAPVPRYFAIAMSDNTPDAHLVLYSVTGNNAANGGVYKNKTLYRSDDRGVTWVEAGNPIPGQINTLAAGNNGKLYAAISGNGIWFAEQGGPVEGITITTPNNADSVVVGYTLKLSPKFTPNSPTNKNVTWSSSNPDVATIDQTGLVTGVSVGTTTISIVTEDGGKTDTQEIRVTPIVTASSIAAADVVYITPRTTRSIIATVLPANTTNKTLTWTSSDPTVLTVDENGTIHSLAKDTAYITVATVDGGASKQITVIVNSVVKAINAGSDPRNGGGNATYQNSVIGQFIPEGPDGSGAPGANNWHCHSYNSVIPTTQAIDISATQNPAPIDVYRSLRRQNENICRLNYIFRDLIAGGEYTLRLHFMEHEFTTNGKRNFNVYTNGKNDSIKNMDIFKEAGGRWKPITRVLKVKADNLGVAGVTFVNAQVGNTSYFASISALELLMQEANGIEFSNAPTTVAVQSAAQFEVKFLPSNTTNKALIWSSSNPEIVAVDSKGMITGVAEGTATITVIASDGGFTLSKEVTAIKVNVESLTIDPAEKTLSVGQILTIVPTVLPANATYKTVEWTSSNDSLASVSAEGVVTAKAKGTVTITAKSTDNETITATSTISVVNVPITDLTLATPIDKVGVGSTLQLNGSVVPANASPHQLIWKSSNPTVATVDATGLLTAVSVGTTVISATTQDEVVITKSLNIEVVAMGECGILQNNGFESDFLHWNKVEAPANIAITTAAHVNTGYRAAVLESDAARTTLATNPIDVASGQQINIQAMVKLERVNNQTPSWAGAIIAFYDASGAVLTERRFSAATLTDVYTQYVLQNLNLIAPESAVKMTISYSKTGSGRMYIDDVCPTVITGLWSNYANPFGLKVTPNPVKSTATLSFDLSEGGKMRFRIYSVTGAVVSEREAEMSLGAHTLTFDTSRMSTGIYTVEAMNTETHAKSIVKIVK